MLLSIQYLRAFAAMSVVCWHTGWTRTIVPAAGVDVFFVISGFIMVHVTRREHSPVTFLTARIRRVVPLYWFVTLAVFAVSYSVDWRWLVASLLFVAPTPVLQPGWSLNYEMVFYVVFGMCMVLRKRLAALTLVFIAGLTGTVPPLDDPMCLEFVAGAWLGAAWRHGWPRREGWVWIGFAVLLLAEQAWLMPLDDLWAWRAFFWGLPAMMIVIGALALEARGRVPNVAPLKLLGNASYSIYLSHVPTMALITGRVHWMPTVIALPLVASFCAIVGVLLHFAVEKPLTRLVLNFR